MTQTQLRVLSLGWGVQSWTLAAMAALKCQCDLCQRLGVDRLPAIDYAIHADTTHEREDTYAFAKEWTPWLEARGVPVLTVRSHVPEVWRRSTKSEGKYLLIPAFTLQVGSDGGKVQRQCTDKWKIRPQQKAVNAILKQRGIAKTPGCVEKWLGISKDEWQRAKPSRLSHETHRYPLLELNMTRHACIEWLIAHGLPVPPKSSCVFCPFHTTKAWQEMKRRGGADWAHSLAVDIEIRGVRNDENARKPVQVFVHRSCKPLDQAVVIPEDFGFEQMALLPPNDEYETSCDSGHCFL